MLNTPLTKPTYKPVYLVQSETNKTHAYIAVGRLLLRHQLGERIEHFSVGSSRTRLSLMIRFLMVIHHMLGTLDGIL
jgi:hypothetical protein